jgi:hypothetical protein
MVGFSPANVHLQVCDGDEHLRDEHIGQVQWSGRKPTQHVKEELPTRDLNRLCIDRDVEKVRVKLTFEFDYYRRRTATELAQAAREAEAARADALAAELAELRAMVAAMAADKPAAKPAAKPRRKPAK